MVRNSRISDDIMAALSDEDCCEGDEVESSEEDDARTKVGGATGRQAGEESGQESGGSDSDLNKDDEDDDDDSDEHEEAQTVPGRGKPKAKAKAGGKAGCQCSGCWKGFCLDDMYPGTAFCRACKKAYDCLQKLSVKQKRKSWWKKTRENAKSLKQIIAKFKKMCPDLNCGRGKKRSSEFSISKFVEVHKAWRAKTMNKDAVLMTEEDFLGFAQAKAPLGWGLSETKAKLHWQEITDDPKNKPIMQRRGGENVKLYPCRIHMKMRDQTGFSKGKQVENEFEAKKKATDEDRTRMKRKIFNQHEALEDDSGDDGIANVMAQAAECGQSAFDSHGMGMDLQAAFIDKPLVDDATPRKKARKGENGQDGLKSPGRSSAASSAGGGPASLASSKTKQGGKPLKPGGPQQAAKNPKKCSANIASQIANAVTQFDNKVKNLEDDIGAMEVDANGKLQYYRAHRDADHYSALAQIAEARLKILAMVHSSDAKKLRAALAEIQSYLKSGSRVHASKAPPIALYDQLMCLRQLKERRESFQGCQSADDVKSVWSELNPLVARIKELLAAVKQSLTDLVNAEKARRRVAKLGTEEDRDQKEKKKTSNLAELKVPFFERLASHKSVKEVDSVAHRDMTKLSSPPAAPLLIRDVPWSKEVLKAISEHKEEYDSFKPVFKSSKARRTAGHGSRAISEDDEAELLVKAMLETIFMGSEVVDAVSLPKGDISAARQYLKDQRDNKDHKGEKHAIAHACLPSIFGMRSFLEIGGPEVGGLGCIRVQHEGTKHFACCHVSDWFAFLCQNGMAADKLTCQAAYDYMKSSMSETIYKFCNSGAPLWRVTQGPHEALVIPSGMFSFDETLGADVFGHKIGILCPTAKTAADLLQLRRDATRRSMTKEAEDVSKTIAYLKLEACVEALNSDGAPAAAEAKSPAKSAKVDKAAAAAAKVAKAKAAAEAEALASAASSDTAAEDLKVAAAAAAAEAETAEKDHAAEVGAAAAAPAAGQEEEKPNEEDKPSEEEPPSKEEKPPPSEEEKPNEEDKPSEEDKPNEEDGLKEEEDE